MGYSVREGPSSLNSLYLPTFVKLSEKECVNIQAQIHCQEPYEQ